MLPGMLQIERVVRNFYKKWDIVRLFPFSMKKIKIYYNSTGF